jgi:hypothetical protein
VASAMLLDVNHEDIKSLLQTIYNEKSLNFTKKTIKELEMTESKQ